MSKFRIRTEKGTTEEVEGVVFKHYIGKYQYQFGYESSRRAITSIDSGYLVGHVNFNSLAAHLGDHASAAKACLDDLCKRVTPQQVKDKIDSAPKL